MPCNTITTATVDLRNADLAVLADALRADSWTVSVEGGKLSAYSSRGSLSAVTGQAPTVRSRTAAAVSADIARLYGRQCVLAAAKRNGWRVADMADGRLKVERGW